MKQIILSFLLVTTLLAISTPTYAGETSTNQVQSASPTVNQLVDKFGSRLDSLLTVLAAKTGVAIDHFYPIFVVQQRITGIVNISMMVILGITLVFVLRFALYNAGIYNSADYHSKDRERAEPKMIVGYVIGAIIGIIFTIFTLTQITETIGQIANPEYYAVQSLVQMVR